jgi:hypothetical protein
MRHGVSILSLLALTGGAMAEEPRRLGLTAADPVEEADARATRSTGIGLFVGGLIVTLASVPLTALAFVAPSTAVAEQQRYQQGMTIAGAVTTIAGNGMLAAGLGLWGTGNGRLRQSRSRGRLGVASVAVQF